jgi:hypothetical protein
VKEIKQEELDYLESKLVATVTVNFIILSAANVLGDTNCTEEFNVKLKLD